MFILYGPIVAPIFFFQKKWEKIQTFFIENDFTINEGRMGFKTIYMPYCEKKA